MERYLDVRVEVAAAIATGRPVVALESTVYAHGLPAPESLRAAATIEAAVREEGAVPATLGIVDGRVVVGLTMEELEALTHDPDTAKVSLRDIAPVLASRRPGATTVAATTALASEAGIRVMATGGIGGVHRGARNTLDISADLRALAEHPTAVVCSGAKSVLDLAHTLEALETLGVPVLGYRTREFPAFYAAESGLMLEHAVNEPAEIAAIVEAQAAVGRGEGVLVVQPPPSASAVASDVMESWIEAALEEAAEAGIEGKDVTPFLLGRIARASEGRALRANLALLEANARLAARIALCL
jgi:pseudouridine-5'-phosphate glycosidase